MRPSSAKAKGRKLQQWVCKQISRFSGLPWGPDENLASREMGQGGWDVRLTGDAREYFPFGVECKNQETWSVEQWATQSERRMVDQGGRLLTWLLFLKKNRRRELVVMDARFFFRLWDEFVTLAESNRNRFPTTSINILENWDD